MIRIRSRSRARAEYQRVDFISKLPDEALSLIISKLPIDEAIRTSVLSKRWRRIWRFTPHLEIEGRRMIMPLSQRQALDPYAVLSNAMNRSLSRYGLKISVLLICHSGELHSCRFVHFPYSVAREEVVSWVKLAKVKKVKNLSLKCEQFDIGTLESALDRLELSERISKPNFPPGIFSGLCSLEIIHYSLSSSEPFQGCENHLKTLILKSVYIDDETLEGILENCKGLENFSFTESNGFRKLHIHNPNLKVLQLNALKPDEVVVCSERIEVLLLDSLSYPGILSIYSPNLRVIHSYNNSMVASRFASDTGKQILKASELLGNYRHFWDSRSNVFESLSKLSIDMDLNDVRDCRLISSFMKLCTSLETLEITLPVRNDMINRGVYWDLRVACNCVQDQLKYVYLGGFKGNSQEFEFLKHIITNGRKLVRIMVICSQAIEEERLLSLRRASPNLSIIIKFKIHRAEHELYYLQHRALISYK